MTSSTKILTGTHDPIYFNKADGTAITSRKTIETTTAGASMICNENSNGTYNTTIYPANLYADLSSAYATTINVIREAFAAQKILERDARGGTRYTEILKSHFGVTSPDARQQRPEYLGGKRIPITINQIEQTSSTDATSPQGNVSGYSLTSDADMVFTKSFTEHGIILGLCCVRQDHS